MAEKTIYVGNGKESKYGINISICLSDLPKEHITTAKNGKKYINLKVNKRDEADQYQKTHFVAVDTWKPTPKAEDKGSDVSHSNQSDIDDLPF